MLLQHLRSIAISLSAVLFFLLGPSALQAQDAPLIDAIKSDDVQEFNRLLEANADPNEADEGLASALMWSAYKGNIEAVNALVSAGADCSRKGIIWLNADSTGYYGSLIGAAAGEGHLEIVKTLVERCEIDVNDREVGPGQESAGGWNALQWAAAQGHDEIVTFLLDQDARIDAADTVVTNALLSPLILALQQSKYSTAKLLVESGADVNARDLQGATPIFYAVVQAQMDLVELFHSQGADLRVNISNGLTPLTAAAVQGHEPVVRQLFCLLEKEGGDEGMVSSALAAARSRGQYHVSLFLENPSCVEDEVTELAVALRLHQDGVRYRQQGLVLEAKEAFEKAMALRSSIYGESHSEVIKSMNQLAIVLLESEQLEESLPLFMATVEFTKTYYGEQNTDYAQGLINLGDVHYRMGEYSKSLELYEKSLPIFKQILGENNPRVANALIRAGNAHRMNNEFEKGREFYSKSIDVYRSNYGNYHGSVATAVNNLGLLEYSAGNNEEALELLRQGLDIRLRVFGENHILFAESLTNLGDFLSGVGGADLQEAKIYLEQALAIYRSAYGDSLMNSSAAGSLNILRRIHAALGEYEQADRYGEQSIQIYRSILGQDHPTVATVLANIGVGYRELGQYEKADSVLMESLAIREARLGPNHGSVVDNYIALAINTFLQGDFYKSKELHERALAITRSALGEDHPKVATILGNLGVDHIWLGNYEKAEELILRALALQRARLENENTLIATTLNNLATLYAEVGKFEQALKLQEEVLDINKAIYGSKQFRVATSIDNLAIIKTQLGDHHEALRLLEESLAIRQELYGENHDFIAISFNNIGVNYSDIEDYDKALEFHEKSYDIYVKNHGKEHSGALTALNNIAVVKSTLGENQEALQMHKELESMYKGVYGDRHPSLVLAYSNIAEAYIGLGDFERAYHYTQKSTALRKDVIADDHPNESVELSRLGIIAAALDSLNAAHTYLIRSNSQALDFSESILPSMSYAEQAAFLDYNAPYQINLFLSYFPGKTDELSQAYQVHVPWKGRLLSTLRQSHELDRLISDSDSTIADSAQALKITKRQIKDLYFASQGSQPGDRRARLESLNTRKESLERYLASVMSVQSLEDPLSDETISSLQSLMQPGELVLDFYKYKKFDIETGQPGDHHYGVVLLPTSGAPMFVSLGEAEPIETNISRWRTLIHTRPRVADQLWLRIKEQVWDVIEEELPESTERLWVSPDADLSLIPWRLFSEETYEMTLIDSVRELLLLRSQERTAASPQLLAVGDITYDEVVGALDAAQKVDSVAKLPGTQSELVALGLISEQAQVDVQKLSGSAATMEEVVSRLPDVTHAHLATHGFFFGETSEIASSTLNRTLRFTGSDGDERPTVGRRNPLVESGLALAGYNLADETTGRRLGRLTAEDLVGLDLSKLELIVLSACDTGRGRLVSGQGVMGLRSSLITAGAQRVLMSLWKVPDEATAILMNTFYEGLFVEGLTASKALQKAQQEVRSHEDGRYSSVRYWGAWTLAGLAWE